MFIFHRFCKTPLKFVDIKDYRGWNLKGCYTAVVSVATLLIMQLVGSISASNSSFSGSNK